MSKHKPKRLDPDDEAAMFKALADARESLWRATQLAQQFAPIRYADELVRADNRIQDVMGGLRALCPDKPGLSLPPRLASHIADQEAA